MIALVLSMIRARRAQAVTVALLALFATAAAVSGPGYAAAADRSVVATVLTAASPADRAITAAHTRRTADSDRNFETGTPAALTVDGFATTFAVETDAALSGPARGAVPPLVYRDDVCPHVRLLSGRCVMGLDEAIVTEGMAAHLGARVGSVVGARYAAYDPVNGWVAGGDPGSLSIVGIYAPMDPSEPYWGGHLYFDQRPGERGEAEAVFTTRRTLELLIHAEERQSVDAVVDAGAITPDRVVPIRRDVHTAVTHAREFGGQLTTNVPALLDRVDRNRSLVAQVVPIAAVPLVLLSWFVIFLAVAYATQERRQELGLLALRGVRPGQRWWLAAGESLLPILVGAPVGYLLGHAVVQAAADAWLPGAGRLPESAGETRYALLAVAGAVFAGLLGQRRELARPTVELLREIPGRFGRWRGVALETLVVMLAAVAVVQLRTAGSGLAGVALLAPALVVLAAGLLAARAVGPLAERVGARALRRGRLATTLAAYGLSRRPGGQRLLVLLVVAVALLCFSATAGDVAAQARTLRGSVELGAPRVLEVDELSRRALLDAVRDVDPDGRFAMAVVQAPSAMGNEPPKLALDSTRLRAVALWPGGGPADAAAVAARLRPPSPSPYVLRGSGLVVDASLREAPTLLRLKAYLAPLNGGAGFAVALGDLRTGRHTYTGHTLLCRQGCRFAGLEVTQAGLNPFVVDLTVHGIGQLDPDAPLVAPDRLSADGAWHAPTPYLSGALVPTVAGRPDGLHVTIERLSGNQVDCRILPTDAPYPLPVVTTAHERAGQPLGGVDGNPQPTVQAGRVELLPRLGSVGAVMDLEYADRLTTDIGTARHPEVWLGRAAPPDVVDRLRARGLVIVQDRSLADLQTSLNRQGPAVALRFHQLAGVLAILLALGALWLVTAVDRRRQAGELRALRLQGVSRRAIGGARLRGYLAIVAAALVLGPLAAALAWLLVGARVPLFADALATVPLPRWPDALPVAVPLLLAGAALAGMAVVTARAGRGLAETARIGRYQP